MTTWDDKPNDYEHAVAWIEHLQSIVELARHVRETQRKYFETRDRNILVECKNLERALDEALK